MDQRPNILFCIADDASHFSYNSHGMVRTPHIDDLARDGAIFTNAFTTNPKCAPSRACILSGLFPWQLKDACNHNCYFPPDIAVYPDLLEQAGYQIGFTGKGWAPGDFLRSGRTQNPAGPEYNAHTLVPPEDSCISDCDYTANFQQFLAQKEPGQPFCFWYGCREPHRPYNLGESCAEPVQPEDVTILPSYWPDDPLVRRDILDYAFEINWFDRHIGQMVAELKRQGLYENTLILVTSDNGMPFPRIKGQMYEQDFHLPLLACWPDQLSGGQIINDLISFVDFAPTFLAAAGLESSSMAGQSFLSLLQDQEDSADRSYVYFGREKHDVGRVDDLGYPVRCIRDQDWLYIINYKPDRWPAGNPQTQFTNCDFSPTKELILQLAEAGQTEYRDSCFSKRPAEELFFVKEDVECLHNLAEQPDYQVVKERLRQKLLARLDETKDPRHLGQGDIFDNYPIFIKGIRPHSWQSYLAGTFTPIGPAYKRVKCMQEE